MALAPLQRHKITAQRGPAPRSCIGFHTQVLRWAPHVLGPALVVTSKAYRPGVPKLGYMDPWGMTYLKGYL